jgi:hypothetical protein
LDSINPNEIEDEFSELEILGGSTKAAGMMHFKIKAD